MSNAESSIVLRGGCCCGRVQYTSTSLPSDIQHCHCIMCRRLSGSAFLTFADFPTSSVTLDPSASLQTLYLSDVAERGYCSACGTPITMKYACEPEKMSIAAGTIDEESVERGLGQATAHIFLSQKAGWYTVGEDGLKRWDRFSDDFQVTLEGWKKVKKGTGKQ